MDRSPNSDKIIGFVNFMMGTVGPQIIVTISNDNSSIEDEPKLLKLIYPNNSKYLSKEKLSVVRNQKQFTPHTSEAEYTEGVFAYLFKDGITVSNEKDLLKRLIKEYYYTTNTEEKYFYGSTVKLRMKPKYIPDLITNGLIIQFDELTPIFNMFLIKRRTKSGKSALKFYIQHLTNSGYKTDFKKNINNNQSLEEIASSLSNKFLYHLGQLLQSKMTKYTKMEFIRISQ